LLRYLRLYLEKREEFVFYLEPHHLRDIIFENVGDLLYNRTADWRGYNLIELCRNNLYGFIAYDGAYVPGINDYFAELGIPLIP
jgi:hypothetical protein